VNKQTVNGKTYESKVPMMFTIGNKNLTGFPAFIIGVSVLIAYHAIFVGFGYWLGTL
jgi:hypothetical protein